MANSGPASASNRDFISLPPLTKEKRRREMESRFQNTGPNKTGIVYNPNQLKAVEEQS
jgi:hypothetical protein